MKSAASIDELNLTKREKLEFLLSKLHKYGVRLEAGENKTDPRNIRIYLDNWIDDFFEILMDEQEEKETK